MPETYDNYTYWEVLLNVIQYMPMSNGKEKGIAGDIIDVRAPHRGIGRKEISTRVLIRLDGLDSDGMLALSVPLENDDIYSSWRYAIPFSRLDEIYSVDISRLLDPRDIYQPFLSLDRDGSYIYTSPVFPVCGLVFDKITQEFI